MSLGRTETEPAFVTEATTLTTEPDLTIEREFLPTHAELFAELMEIVCWDERLKARKTASYGKSYDYSGMTYEPREFPNCLAEVVDQLTDRLRIPFNNCLLNLYATGRKTMGFHADDTTHLLPGTGVAIVSLGSERTLTFRSMDQSVRVAYPLPPGSLLYMGPEVQTDWMHAVGRQQNVGPRISLTWRAIQ